LSDVGVDPDDRHVTHLVVERYHRHRDARLVPLTLLRSGGRDRSHLVGIETVLSLPEHDAGGPRDAAVRADPHVAVSYDRVPIGAVELRRASVVIATDRREVGRVDGLVVDGEGAITHLLVRRGDRCGRRAIRIPAAAVARLDNDAVWVTSS
jgi:hypothetical protein